MLLATAGLWSWHRAVRPVVGALSPPPTVRASTRRDNAHNNLAQIAGELGLVGLTTFVIVLVASFWSSEVRSRKRARVSMPLLLGLAAFILTWLGGHPLLVPEVAYPFWITLGASAACISMQRRDSNAAKVVMVGACCRSCWFRSRSACGAKSAASTFRASPTAYPDETAHDLARTILRARDRTHVEFPLRARGASDNEPVEIDRARRRHAAKTITLTDRNGERTRIELARRFVATLPPDRTADQAGSDDPYDPGRSSKSASGR